MRVINHLHRLDVRGPPVVGEGAWCGYLQFVQATWQQLGRDKVIIRASGLAYSSLLAAVPLVAVAFAMFSAFGAFDDIKQRVQEFLFSQFLPTSQDEIVEYVNQFADSASRLGLIGFLFLVLAAILLLDNIESNFNQIWHVTSPRRFIAKITSYTSVLVFGTLLLGASITISARSRPRFSGIFHSTQGPWRSSAPGSSRWPDVSRLLADVPGDSLHPSPTQERPAWGLHRRRPVGAWQKRVCELRRVCPSVTRPSTGRWR